MRRHRQGLTAALFLAPYLLVFCIFRFGPSVAGLLNRELRFRNAIRTITIIPYILIPAVVGILWNWLYDTNFGILNYYLKVLGARPVEWLTSEKWALFAVAIVTIWSYIGYNLVLFLAGLQGIPNELYEAVRIDGANSVQAFFRITLPLLKPITSMVLTMTFINTIQVFDQIFVMTNGGPGTATLTLVQYLYGTAFQNFNMGYGSTISCAVLVILVAIVAVQSRLFREKA